MPAIMVHDYDNEKRLLSSKECSEIYNALADRVRAIENDLKTLTLPGRVHDALRESLTLCEKLVEVFE